MSPFSTRPTATSWYVDQARIAEWLGDAADNTVVPFVHWTDDGRALVATRTHLVYLTAQGELSDAVPLPDPQWPDRLQLLPDGRVQLSRRGRQGFGDPRPGAAGARPGRLAGVVWHATLELLLVGSEDDVQAGAVRYTLHDALTLEAVSRPVVATGSRGGIVSPDGSTRT